MRRFSLQSAALLLTAASLAAAAPPSNVTLPAGYTMTAVATGLDFPAAMTFQNGTIWVAESGIGPSPPTVKGINPGTGTVATILTAAMLPPGTLVAPLTGIVSGQGWLWLVHRQNNPAGVPVGAVSRFQASNPLGTFQTVMTGFPAFGDNPGSQIVFGPDGRGYLNVGPATNSGVVGPDNAWALKYPYLHDFPAMDIALSGFPYQTQVPFPPLDPGATGITEPFLPFGSGLVPPGTILPAPTPAAPIDGIIAGSGAVYSFDPDIVDLGSFRRR